MVYINHLYYVGTQKRVAILNNEKMVLIFKKELHASYNYEWMSAGVENL